MPPRRDQDAQNISTHEPLGQAIWGRVIMRIARRGVQTVQSRRQRRAHGEDR
jgi:hypothetical protein